MYKSNNQNAINALRGLNIWIPGDPVTDREEAFGFWAEVFQWEAKATTSRQRTHRGLLAKQLVGNLNCGYRPKSGVCLNKPYYEENKALAWRFFRTVQSRIEQSGGTWCWSKGPHTALSWETPQTEDSADNIT
jgi:predicted enzyme related to lactoylglutathione lyase